LAHGAGGLRNYLLNRLPEINLQPLLARDFELVWVEAELVQDGGVQVGDVVAVFDGVKADFVGRTVGHASLVMPPPAIQTEKLYE
jgi:hypothetical protein